VPGAGADFVALTKAVDAELLIGRVWVTELRDSRDVGEHLNAETSIMAGVGMRKFLAIFVQCIPADQTIADNESTHKLTMIPHATVGEGISHVSRREYVGAAGGHGVDAKVLTLRCIE